MRAQLQIAHDQKYVAAQDHACLHDSCRRLSGMISNFIAHLQQSHYVGEKSNRPRRQAVESARERQESLRAAQLANMRPADPHTPADAS